MTMCVFQIALGIFQFVIAVASVVLTAERACSHLIVLQGTVYYATTGIVSEDGDELIQLGAMQRNGIASCNKITLHATDSSELHPTGLADTPE